MDRPTNYGGHATAEQALDEVVRRLVEASTHSPSICSAAGHVKTRVPTAVST
jgi:hypothetical protein